ncbi:hypothetical protein JQ580_31795 [Bradyrhizobium japonicum]|uniref:hypothetical protein n=1 Tax=Bradyrhizobium TaxID=374 RepID=UPI000D118BB6|nr:MULTISPECIES: hypothetical protein [Bradyrhizobium]MBR0995303.1 hypothetical protein [Bradyrhizobium japonicum]PSO13862.1 hypothetical protein C7G42_34275 [Bradyrhizobium sp. MOS003]
MKKIGFVVAALGALVIAAPTLASAETVVIKRGGYHHHHAPYGARAEFRGHRDHGWHRGWHNRNKVVVIKRSHRHHWD